MYLGESIEYLTCWFDESLFVEATATDNICFALILDENFQEHKVQLHYF